MVHQQVKLKNFWSSAPLYIPLIQCYLELLNLTPIFYIILKINNFEKNKLKQDRTFFKVKLYSEEWNNYWPELSIYWKTDGQKTKGSHQKKNRKKSSQQLWTMGGGQQILVCEPQKSAFFRANFPKNMLKLIHYVPFLCPYKI